MKWIVSLVLLCLAGGVSATWADTKSDSVRILLYTDEVYAADEVITATLDDGTSFDVAINRNNLSFVLSPGYHKVNLSMKTLMGDYKCNFGLKLASGQVAYVKYYVNQVELVSDKRFQGSAGKRNTVEFPVGGSQS